MNHQDETRRALLAKLSRKLMYTTPILALAASGATFQAMAGDMTTNTDRTLVQQEMTLANFQSEGEAEGEAEGEGEGEAEGEAEEEEE